MGGAAWAAANSAERRLARAWADDDADRFADVLLHADLFLPGFADDGASGQRLLTRERGGRTFLLVYTSVEALQEAIPAVGVGWRRTTFAELAGSWPNPAWGLAVSPNTPIGAYLDAEQVRLLGEEVAAEPPFAPGGERERAMRAAQRAGDAEVYLDLLVTADVLLPLAGPAGADDLGKPGFPWLVQRAAGVATVPLFTSRQRLRDVWPDSADRPAVVEVPLLSVVRAWPGAAYRMVVNPGSPMIAEFTGAQVPDLWRWAQELVLRRTSASQSGSENEPLAEQPVVAGPRMRRVQALVDPSVALGWLAAGGGRISASVGPAGAVGILDGYLVRWHEDETLGAATRPVVELELPYGAQLVRLVAGQEIVVATYDAELSWWRPSIMSVLRGEAR
ncbi:hypothetical protein ACWT_5730 [Actinoplanes sp. SE50]|uniref:SseB family protein n=1 Tax=unclassified Actinoplanes TaxID=2626549 RepID=UPI00023ED4BE|nr:MULTISPECIES: SseB family protein [unclassified Actinoplanes]AEV86748.1 hypothetical protein ACPL_5861 [Actinoplanes sp. SE50/110]ATO85145.1 hypothetical protein ACWT_5730 [Actinoplanes sp. SE50]SLM02556.1 hypothetical protein ACSP50_5806 [Actinoplanes sp. SE50/110]